MVERKPNVRWLCPPFPWQSVSLEESSYALQVGESVQVNYIFAPEDTTERKITFSISDPSIAQISADGTLTARAAGEAVLAIFAQDGLEYDTAVVSVSQPDPTYRALVAGVYTDIDGSNRRRRGQYHARHLRYACAIEF